MIEKTYISKDPSVQPVTARKLCFPQSFVHVVTRILFYTGYLPFRFRPIWCNTSQSFFWVTHKNRFQKLFCICVHILISLYTVYEFLKSLGWVENGKYRKASMLHKIYNTLQTCSTLYFTCSVWFSESQWRTLLTSRQQIILPYTLKETIENNLAILFPVSWVLSAVYFYIITNQDIKLAEPWNLKTFALIPLCWLTLLEYVSDIMFLAIAINFRDAPKPLKSLLSKEIRSPSDVVLNEFKKFEKQVEEINENCGVWIFIHNFTSISYNSLHLLQIFKEQVHTDRVMGNMAFFGVTFVFLMMVASTSSNVNL